MILSCFPIYVSKTWELFLVHLESNCQTAIRVLKMEKEKLYHACLLSIPLITYNREYEGSRDKYHCLKRKACTMQIPNILHRKLLLLSLHILEFSFIYSVQSFLTTGSLDACLEDEKSHQSLSDSWKIKNHYWITVHLIYLVLMCY